MNKSPELSLITFSFIILFFIPIIFISSIYAQIFEFNAEDYFDIESEKNTPTTINSEDISSTTILKI